MIRTLLSGLFLLGLVACSGSGKGPVGPATEGGPAGEATPRGNSVPGSAPSWGSESSASAPAMPYVPTEPFEYKCEISLRADSYPSDSSGKGETYLSTSIVIIDNHTTGYNQANTKWAHFKKGEDGFIPMTTLPPYPLDASFMMSFSWPDDKGVTPVGLGIWMTISSDATLAQHISNRSNVGVLTDKNLETSVNHSQLDNQAKLYKTLVAKMSCEKTK